MCSSVATYVFSRCPTWSARQQRTPWFSPWQSPGFPWSLTQSQMTFLSPMSTSCDTVTVVSYMLDSVSSSLCEWNWQKTQFQNGFLVIIRLLEVLALLMIHLWIGHQTGTQWTKSTCRCSSMCQLCHPEYIFTFLWHVGAEIQGWSETLSYIYQDISFSSTSLYKTNTSCFITRSNAWVEDLWWIW